ncbi:MAG: homoserine kinase [Hyphomicrobiaceae bacterium]|nr:homoserine kinase [Hyphomicrobiaceae bacterium]
MAVYTEVADDQLATFIASYGLGAVLSCKGIAEGVENTNYLVTAERGRFILTLYERRVNPAELPFFLGLMEHLASRGLSCPTPVRDSEGRNLRELAGRPAALVTFLEGLWPRRPSADHCLAVGAALARMHLAAADFRMTRRNGLGLDDWRPLYDRFKGAADEIRPGLGRSIERELAFLEGAWPRHLPAGIIHADLFPDNVFFLGDELSGLIDFYFACTDQLAYDVAICINAWGFEADGAFNVTKGRALLKGYESVRPLSADERAALPILARGSALRFLLTRAYDWINTPPTALVKRKDPIEYLRRLGFHQAIASPGAYGLEEPRP